MRGLIALLLFVIPVSLADANQQALTRVQWLQLMQDSSSLTYAEKLNRVQDLFSLVVTRPYHSTQIVSSYQEVFDEGKASEAEIAYGKWQALVELGFAASDFRLVYMQHNLTSKNHVALAWYFEGQVLVLTDEQVFNAGQMSRLYPQLTIISVETPINIEKARRHRAALTTLQNI